MQEKSVIRAILTGPISDTGQLALAYVIFTLAGEDGWVASYRKDLATTCRATPKTVRKWVSEMLENGWLEERKKPIPGLRLTEEALNREGEELPPKGEFLPPKGENLPPAQGGRNDHPEGSRYHQGGSIYHPPCLPACLPKRSKDLKEEDIGDSSSSADVVVGKGAAPPRSRRAPAENPKARISRDWQPLPETLDNLAHFHGIPRAFAETLIWEYVTYWIERGTARPGWDATFANHAKNQWKREQAHEQNAEQRRKYTDASGKPISEADYLARENARRVIADMESGLLDNFDLNTPV